MFKNYRNKYVVYIVIGLCTGIVVLLWSIRTISDAWADSKQIEENIASSSAELNVIQMNQAIESVKKRKVGSP
jgi:hypothetical protein